MAANQPPLCLVDDQIFAERSTFLLLAWPLFAAGLAALFYTNSPGKSLRLAPAVNGAARL